METNHCLNLQEDEGKVGDIGLKRAEKVSNKVEVPSAVEDISFIVSCEFSFGTLDESSLAS